MYIRHRSHDEGSPRLAARLPSASHQLQHPRASSAGGKAPKQAKNNDDGSCANEDIRGVGGVVRYQGDVWAQHQLPPYSHCKQDGSCYLSMRGGGRDTRKSGKLVSRTEAEKWCLSLRLTQCNNRCVVSVWWRGEGGRGNKRREE